MFEVVNLSRVTTYNSIYTPELWGKVNPENKALLRDFLAYKTSSNKSHQTIEQYGQILRLFFCWNLKDNDNKFFCDIKKRDFVRFFGNAVTEWRWSSNRTAMVKSVLSSLSNYIENILDDEYENFRNIVTKIEVSEKQLVREKTVLTQEQIDFVLAELTKQKKFQAACYFALAIASGARKQELLRFKTWYFKDEYIEYGCLYKTPEKIKTKGRTNQGKMLYKYTFANIFKPYYELWMKQREELGIESEWLFVTKELKTGNYVQAEIGSADFWCKTISKILGVPFYSHAARHRYVTMMKESKLPDSVVVYLMGWSKTSGANLIGVYSDLDDSEELADYFDENGIKTDIKVGSVSDIGGGPYSQRKGF